MKLGRETASHLWAPLLPFIFSINPSKALPDVTLAESLIVFRIGRWLLLNSSSSVYSELSVITDEKVRSLVDGLPVERSIRIPKPGGFRSVKSVESISAVQIDTHLYGDWRASPTCHDEYYSPHQWYIFFWPTFTTWSIGENNIQCRGKRK
jgi:hypothetical protein